MANIADQAAFDALLQANEARYEDSTSTLIQGATVTALNNFVVTTPSLASDSNASNFTADNCFINLTDTTSTSAGDNWLGGSLNLTNSTVNYSGGVAGSGIEYPGFRIVAGTDLNDRYTLNLNNSTLLCSRDNNARWTLHFQGAAPTGHNLTNTTFGFGVVPYFLFGMADLVGVTFSGQSANTAAPQGGVSVTNLRIDNPAGTGGNAGAAQPIYDARWWGLFGCDFRNWTNVDTVININQTTFGGHFIGGNDPFFFIVDGQFSTEILGSGFRLGTDRGNYAFVSGVSFNPLFRDNITTAPLTDAIQVDFGTNTIWEAQAARDFNTLPTVVDNAGIVNVNAAGQNGYIIQVNRNNDQGTGTPRLAAPRFLDALNYWSYTHQSYSVGDGSNLNIVPTARTWTNSFQFADTQNIDLVAEPALNSRDLAAATGFVANGVANLNDVFPAFKALYYNNRNTTFPFFASTPTEFNTNNIDVALVNNQETDFAYNATDVEIAIDDTNEFNLNGGTINTGTGALSGVREVVETIVSTGVPTYTLAGNLNNVAAFTTLESTDAGGNFVQRTPADFAVDADANTITFTGGSFPPVGRQIRFTYNSSSNATVSNGTIDVTTLDLSALNIAAVTMINGGTVDGIVAANANQIGNINFTANTTIRLTENIDISRVTLTGNVTFSGTGTVRLTSVQNQQATFTENTASQVILSDVTFQSPENQQGQLALLHYDPAGNGGNGEWTQIGTTQDATTTIRASIVSNMVGEHLAIWRPQGTAGDLASIDAAGRISTTFAHYANRAAANPVGEEIVEGQVSTFIIPNSPTVPGLLYQTATTGAHAATIEFSAIGSGTTNAELLGTIINAGDAATAPSAGQTQRLLLRAYSSPVYLQTMIDQIISQEGTNILDADFVLAAGIALTEVDGEYLQLTAGEREINGVMTIEQQFLTSVANVDLDEDGIMGDIESDITGMDSSSRTISYPGIFILDNPQGVTVDEILVAFNRANTGINRGVGYVVQTLDANPIIQAPTGTTYDNTGNTNYPL